MEIITKALEKLADEKERHKNDTPHEYELFLMLYEHMVELCNFEPVAVKVLQEEKSLWTATKKLFQKAKTERRGWIKDAECCRITEEYFGVEEIDKCYYQARKAKTLDDLFALLKS